MRAEHIIEKHSTKSPKTSAAKNVIKSQTARHISLIGLAKHGRYEKLRQLYLNNFTALKRIRVSMQTRWSRINRITSALLQTEDRVA
jgi:hypothetical protein